MHEEFLKNEDGTFKLDADGQKIKNPEYVPPAGFEMTSEIQAFLDSQTAELKRSLATAQNSVAGFKKRAETAEANATRLETDLQEVRGKIASGDFEIDPKEKLQLETRITQLEGEVARLTGDADALKIELHTYKVTGRIDRASAGLIKKQYMVPAKATLETLIKEGDDGTLECFMPDGTPALDLATGDPMTVENFMTEVFVKHYPEMCVADAALPSGQPPKPGTTPKGDNPFHKDTVNRTVQSTMIKNNKPLARSLMQQAGYEASKIARMLGDAA